MEYRNVNQGDTFFYGGYKWIKLDDNGLSLMEKILEHREYDDTSNDWDKSSLRKYLNNDFLEILVEKGAKRIELLPIHKDIVSLMTEDVYQRYKHMLKPLETWWWLSSSYTGVNATGMSVKAVTNHNYIVYDGAYVDYGIRPIIRLRPDTVVYVFNNSLFGKMKEWAIDRNLNEADPCKQMLKLAEETGELAEGIAKNRPIQIEDSIGDIIVVLTVLSLQLDLDIEECMRIAYNEIKDRKGQMVNGVFVKESDL